MKNIITFEYSEVKYAEIFDEEHSIGTKYFKKFIKSVEKKYKHCIKLEYDSIKLMNFIGVIKINDCLIEVMPKMFKTSNQEINKELIYRNLYYMLDKANKVKYRNVVTEEFNKAHVSILDYYINIFLQELNDKIRPNLYHTYENTIENRRSIKGKIVVTKNLKKNLYNLSKNICKYDEFTENNLVNQILKFTTKKMLKVTKWIKNKKLCKEILNRMIDIEDIHVTNDTFYKIKHDKNLYYLEKILSMAQNFVNNLFTTFENKNKQDIFIFNFDMNFLFQEYIAKLLEENKSYILGENMEVLTQKGKQYLVYDQGVGKLRLIPDVIIEENKNPKIIIDTKYKIISQGNSQSEITRNDLFQMYAYMGKYHVEKAILLYPEQTNSYKRKYQIDKDKKDEIFVCTVNLKVDLLTEEDQVIEQLKQIILMT